MKKHQSKINRNLKSNSITYSISQMNQQKYFMVFDKFIVTQLRIIEFVIFNTPLVKKQFNFRVYYVH